MAKRDAGSIGMRLSQEEDFWIRQKAAALEMDISDWLRKCIALAAPILDSNELVRRVAELKDVMKADRKQ